MPPESYSLTMGEEIAKRSVIHRIDILRFFRQFATIIIHLHTINAVRDRV